MFIVAPKIAPFAVDSDALFPGDYFTLQCSIVHGDLPIAIEWSFNGALLGASLGRRNAIVIAAMGTRSSVLTIESVGGEHAGNYTCAGTNAAGQTRHTVGLVVNG